MKRCLKSGAGGVLALVSIFGLGTSSFGQGVRYNGGYVPSSNARTGAPAYAPRYDHHPPMQFADMNWQASSARHTSPSNDQRVYRSFYYFAVPIRSLPDEYVTRYTHHPTAPLSDVDLTPSPPVRAGRPASRDLWSSLNLGSNRFYSPRYSHYPPKQFAEPYPAGSARSGESPAK